MLVLALKSGGYDLVPRSQIGIVVWWIVLLGVAAGVLPAIRVTRSGWIVLAVMTGLVAWTGLAALTWTQSTERSVIELSRVVTLLGFLLTLILLQGKEGIRRSLTGFAAATVVVGVLALASRFHPAWFDLEVLPVNYPKARINYPLGYWNGLATLLAMGVVALLWCATWSRNLVGRALSSAAIPLLIVAMYMTASRGGAIELAAGIAVLIAIAPGRLGLLVRMVVPVVLSTLLVLLIVHRPELRDNVGGSIAESQGNAMIWLTILVFLCGAAIVYLIESRLLARVELPTFSRQAAGRVGAGIAALLLIALVVGIASGFVSDTWTEFKRPIADETSATVARLDSVSSGERYEQWRTAIDAGKAEPLTGIGPGAYEYWWSRNGSGPGFVRDAHSLYLEGFAEMGIVGLLLTLGLVLTPIWIGARAGARRVLDDRRPAMAAATAGMVAFAVAAGIDWAWEMTVLPASFFVLVAAIAGPSAETRSGRLNRPEFRLPFLPLTRVWLSLGSLAAVAVIAVPMIGKQRIIDSQSLYREGDVSGAISKAEQAHDINPWSAEASMQLALLLRQSGDIAGARKVAQEATEEDPYSWKTWYVLVETLSKTKGGPLREQATARIIDLNRNLRVQYGSE